MPKFQFLFDVGCPSMDFVVAQTPAFVFNFSNCDICCNRARVNTLIAFVAENRPSIVFKFDPDVKRQCGTMYLGDIKKHRLCFNIEANKPIFSFCTEQRPQLLFACGDLSNRVTTLESPVMQFELDQTIRFPFIVQHDAKQHCGTMYVGHRFNDDLITSSLQCQVLSLHGCVSAMSSKIFIVAKDISMDLLHCGYRTVTLGDWDNRPLGQIDPETLGTHVFGKVRVNATSAYPETWRMLADKDGNVLATVETEVLVVDS